MATETLTTTTTAVTKVGARIVFPYPSGWAYSDFSTDAPILKVGGTTFTGVFSVSFNRDGASLTPGAGNEVPAGSLTLEVGKVPGAVGGAVGAAANGARFRSDGGSRIAWLGSSTLQGNHSVVTGPPPTFSAGPGIIAGLLQRDPRFDSSTWYDATDTRNFHGGNYGQSGTAMDVQANYVDDIIARGYKAVVLANMGQNDLSATTPISTLLSNLRAIANRLIGGGISVYLNTVNPRAVTGNSLSGGSELAATDVYWRRRIEFNSGVVALAQELGAELIDTRAALEDATSPIKQAKTAVSKDGLHLTDYGHSLWIDAASPVFDRTITPDYPHITLTAATSGNLFTNGLLAGTAGASSFNHSGTVPDKMRVGRVTTGTTTLNAVSTVVADPEEGNAIRTVMTLVSAVSASDEFRWLFTDSAGAGDSSFAVSNMGGKWGRGIVRVYVEEGAQYIQEMRLIMESRTTLNNTGVTFTHVQTALSRSTNEPVVSPDRLASKAFWMVTEPVLMPVGTTHVSLKLQARFVGTGTATVQVSRAAFREVSSPIV